MNYFNNDAYLSNLARSKETKHGYKTALKNASFQEWQSEYRTRLGELLGMPLIDKSALLHPRLVEKTTFDTYTKEKLFITTEPGVEIPFYLLLPKEGTGPFPLVLTPHGHWTRGKEVYTGNYADDDERQEAVDGEHDIALQAVAEGYATIAPDVRGFWEMARAEEMENDIPSSCSDLQRIAMMYGRTLIGERVHDMGKLIDYAATRNEIDASRVVITGNSGGGTVSLFAAAMDERITVAAPSSYFCTFEKSIVSLHHCACNLVPGILQSGEMYDVAGLIAPRPVLMVNGVNDSIFPIDGAREAFSHLQNIYREAGYPDRCELFEGGWGHRYYKERVWEFVKEYL